MITIKSEKNPKRMFEISLRESAMGVDMFCHIDGQQFLIARIADINDKCEMMLYGGLPPDYFVLRDTLDATIGYSVTD